MFKLTTKQNECLEGVRWALYGPKTIGKTTLLLYVTLQEAVKNEGEYYKIIDHFTDVKDKRYLLNNLVDLVNGAFPGYDLTYSTRREEFKMNKRKSNASSR